MGPAIEFVSALSQPWMDVYADSSILEIAVMFLHLGGLLAGGGVAFAMDRAVLSRFRGHVVRRYDLARELELAHRIVLAGLLLLTVSGVALTLADPEIFLTSLAFWIKMALLAALLGNGWILERAGRQVQEHPEDEDAFRGLRAASLRSMALWLLVVLAGITLTIDA